LISNEVLPQWQLPVITIAGFSTVVFNLHGLNKNAHLGVPHLKVGERARESGTSPGARVASFCPVEGRANE
jgi:hypothetical protein